MSFEVKERIVHTATPPGRNSGIFAPRVDSTFYAQPCRTARSSFLRQVYLPLHRTSATTLSRTPGLGPSQTADGARDCAGAIGCRQQQTQPAHAVHTRLMPVSLRSPESNILTSRVPSAITQFPSKSPRTMRDCQMSNTGRMTLCQDTLRLALDQTSPFSRTAAARVFTRPPIRRFAKQDPA